MILSHRIALNPTKDQYQALTCAVGTARFTWNWALAEWNKLYSQGEKPNGNSLQKRWNKIKRVEYPWVYDSPKDANQRPFNNLEKAFVRFFKGLANRPKFKKRGRRDSFYISNDKFSIIGKHIRIPKIGWIRMREHLRFDGKIISATISKKASAWFVSITIDLGNNNTRPCTNNKTIGIDLGLKHTITLSDDRSFDAPKPLRRALKRLRRLNKELGRKQKGSNRRNKTKQHLAKLHARITNIRKDFLHKSTTQICRENQTAVIEDLNVKGMLKNRCLSRAISDVGFHEFRRQLTYKAKLYGINLIVADRWFPSSKMCSSCGYKKTKLLLSERVFNCEECGLVLDRDLNAALNLKSLAVGSTVTVRGEDVRPKTLGSDADLYEARTSDAREQKNKILVKI